MYGTLIDFRAYALARGDSAPTDATDAAATAALVRGSDYIRTRYVVRLGLSDPDTDEAVIEATYIAARREIATPGFWATTYTAAAAKTLIGVDSIRWQVNDNSKLGMRGRDLVVPFDPAIDALLLPFGNVPGAVVV